MCPRYRGLLSDLTYGGAVSAQIWAALIAAGASLVVAIFSASRSSRTQKNITELTSQLQEQRAERDARRDYEYEARKRLYSQCEPVIFEAMELAENFRHRVVSLARSSRMGFLSPDGAGWLAANDYYFKSTAFFLLAPVTSLKVIRRRLTAIDLALEPRMEFQYQLLKLVFHSYTWDFELAGRTPVLEYHPDDADPGKPDREKLLADAPRVYRRQGLYLGIVDQLSDALISNATDSYYYKSLGEFCAEIDNRRSGLGRLSGDITEFFRGFHPASEPVLWRVLITQYLLFGTFLRTQSDHFSRDIGWSQMLPDPSQAEIESLDFGTGDLQAGDANTATSVAICREYLLDQLKDLRDTSNRTVD